METAIPTNDLFLCWEVCGQAGGGNQSHQRKHVRRMLADTSLKPVPGSRLQITAPNICCGSSGKDMPSLRETGQDPDLASVYLIYTSSLHPAAFTRSNSFCGNFGTIAGRYRRRLEG